MLFIVQLKSADSVKNSVFHELSKLTYLTEIFQLFSTMPKGRQFDVAEKTKVMAMFREGVAPKTLLRGWRGTSALWGRSSATTRSCRLMPLRRLPKNGLVVQACWHKKSRRDFAFLFTVSRLRRPGRSRRRSLALPTFLWGLSSVFARRS
jgi:hypothetical protein